MYSVAFSLHSFRLESANILKFKNIKQKLQQFHKQFQIQL
jgi:hypothetical protein